MKVSITRVLVLDYIDIFLISMTTTMGVYHFYKVCKKICKNRQDPSYTSHGKVRDSLALELEKCSPRIAISLKTKSPSLIPSKRR